MAKKKRSATGKQMPLIDVAPENLKAIIPIAKEYREVVARRVKLTAREVTLKNQLLSLVKEAKLSRLPNGNIKFQCDGMVITVKPRDELVQVKNAADE